MGYRSVLVYVSNAADLEQRVQIAARLAENERTTVIGLAITGVSRFMSGLLSVIDDTNTEGPAGPRLLCEEQNRRATLQLQMTAALERFSALAQAYGISTVQQLQVDDEAASALSQYGNAADLIILGRSELTRNARRDESDFVEFVALNTDAPVLTVSEKPFAWRHALIAWNNSAAASRATRAAIPLLQNVGSISAVIFGDGAAPGTNTPASQDELQACLSSLNKPVNIIYRPTTQDIGHALLALAEELDADLIIMGCVAHPRWRGALLGGTTGVVVAQSPVSLLLSR